MMVKSTQAPSDSQRGHLSELYLPAQPLKQKASKRRKTQSEDANDRSYVDPSASRKILRIGRDLLEEDEAEQQASTPPDKSTTFALASRSPDVETSSDRGDNDDEEAWEEEVEDALEETEIDPRDLETFNRFNPGSEGPPPLFGEADSTEDPGTNLTNLILEKIAAHEASISRAPEVKQGDAAEDSWELPPRAVEVYTKVGLILSRYKSGKLPKPFKILPGIAGWETLLALTRPDMWTPNACYEATRIFVSSNQLTAQVFLNTVILDRVRDDIRETKRLNVHLFKALKKALFKPAAFFKGFLFPFVGDGTCTLREAHIVASVLTRVSVPVLHSAAALHRLCEIAAEQMSISTVSGGATNIFIRVLLEKKYALPYKVIDALVFHFLRFRAASTGVASTENDVEMSTGIKNSDSQDMMLPVLWHRCLLVFAQHYRNDITEDQREALLDLLLVKGHKSIGPEVRRELLEGRGRGVIVEPTPPAAGDDTMIID